MKKNIYTCNNCNTLFYNKKKLINHLKNEMQLTQNYKQVCSFENCNKIFKTFKMYINHLHTQTNLKRKIEPQTRFIQKKKTKLQETTTMSPAEEIIIKKSLKDCTDEVINISKSFDHSYI